MHRSALLLATLTFLMILTADVSFAASTLQDGDAFRKWTAANNKFSINAKVLSCNYDSIELESEDGRTFKVAVKKLCDADQAFIKELLSSEENPFAEHEMAENPFVESDESDGYEVETETNRDLTIRGGFGRSATKKRRSASKPSTAPLLPTPGRLKFGRRKVNLKSGDYAVDVAPADELTFESESIDSIGPPTSRRYDFHNRIKSRAISINEKFLASVISNPFEKKSWVTIIDLANGVSSEALELPWEDTKLLSVSPDGKKILTTNHSPQVPSRTDLWKIKGDKLTHVHGWKTRGFHDHSGIKFESAIIINDSKVLSTGTETAVWDLDSGSDDFSLNVKSRPNRRPPVLSPDRRLFAVAVSGRIHIVEILTGEVEGTLERVDDISNWQEMAFSPSGEYFAARSGTDLVIWSLKNGMVDEQFSVLKTGGLAWIDDQYILLGGAIHDTDLRAVVWNYSVSTDNLIALSNGQFLFVDKSGVTKIELPHVEMDDRIDKLDEDDLLVLQEGDVVGLDFSQLKEIDETSIDAIKKTWTEKLFDRGIKVRSGADFDHVLRFTVKVGKQQELEVRDMMDPFPFGGPFGSRRNNEEVKFQRKSASIELVVDGEVVWRKSGRFGPNPIIMHLRDGETAQEHVDRISKVKANFFTSSFIPEGLRALPTKLVGESKIYRGGIE